MRGEGRCVAARRCLFVRVQSLTFPNEPFPKSLMTSYWLMNFFPSFFTTVTEVVSTKLVETSVEVRRHSARDTRHKLCAKRMPSNAQTVPPTAPPFPSYTLAPSMARQPPCLPTPGPTPGDGCRVIHTEGRGAPHQLVHRHPDGELPVHAPQGKIDRASASCYR